MNLKALMAAEQLVGQPLEITLNITRAHSPPNLMVCMRTHCASGLFYAHTVIAGRELLHGDCRTTPGQRFDECLEVLAAKVRAEMDAHKTPPEPEFKLCPFCGSPPVFVRRQNYFPDLSPQEAVQYEEKYVCGDEFDLGLPRALRRLQATVHCTACPAAMYAVVDAKPKENPTWMDLEKRAIKELQASWNRRA